MSLDSNRVKYPSGQNGPSAASPTGQSRSSRDESTVALDDSSVSTRTDFDIGIASRGSHTCSEAAAQDFAHANWSMAAQQSLAPEAGSEQESAPDVVHIPIPNLVHHDDHTSAYDLAKAGMSTGNASHSVIAQAGSFMGNPDASMTRQPQLLANSDSSLTRAQNSATTSAPLSAAHSSATTSLSLSTAHNSATTASTLSSQLSSQNGASGVSGPVSMSAAPEMTSMDEPYQPTPHGPRPDLSLVDPETARPVRPSPDRDVVDRVSQTAENAGAATIQASIDVLQRRLWEVAPQSQSTAVVGSIAG
mmetsp:Transcript_12994/g.28153  ORF Transcript_12994/g.28153 Transcript_12994/m.28153 type:complete len:305 (+) Transcript_12994:2-916(+)